MSNDPKPQKAQSSLTNPQVLTAIIGGVVTLVAAILGFLPAVLNRPAEATAVIVVTATSMPTEVVILEPPTSAPTSVTVAQAQPTTEVVVPTTVIEPTAVPATPIPPTPIPPTPVPPTPVPPTTAPSLPANALLLWDEVSFTAINIGGGRLSLEGVTFVSGSGFWDARDWGPSLYNSVPARDCLRLRDATAGPRNPPSECGELYGLILVGTSALFWRGAETFEVVLSGQVIATCPVAAGRCDVYVG